VGIRIGSILFLTHFNRAKICALANSRYRLFQLFSAFPGLKSDIFADQLGLWFKYLWVRRYHEFCFGLCTMDRARNCYIVNYYFEKIKKTLALTFTLTISRTVELIYGSFPWRFLSVAIFVFSFLGGALALVLSRKTAALVLVVVVFLTANYFQPREWYPNMTDADKFTGKTWVLMTTNAIFDYLPIDAPQPPADPPKADVVFVSGAGKIIRLEKNSHFQRYRIDVEKSGIVEVQTYYFPGWHVYLDGIDQLIDPKRDPVLGRMQVDINTGTHQLVAKFERTWDRKLADTISLVTWVITIGIMGVWWKIRQK